MISRQAMDDIAKMINQQTRDHFCAEINRLVRAGLLEVQLGEASLALAPLSDQVQLLQRVELRVKGQERIEQLERENAELKTTINNLLEGFESVSAKISAARAINRRLP